MNSTPLRIPHPHRSPAPVRVRSSSRRAVLDALEYVPLLSRAHLSEITDLGETTLRHAIRQLSREGVLTPQSGRNAGTVSIARYSALPVLEIAPRHMIWRLCDTLGGSVFATVRDRGGFRSAEDDFVALMGQVATILRGGACGLSKEIPLQPPVLLCSDSLGPDIPPRLPLPESPTAILSPKQAIALEIRYLPATRKADTTLLLQVGADTLTPAVTLFTRAEGGGLDRSFIPSPMTADLDQSLLTYVEDTPAYTRNWWLRIAAFLRDLCRFIRTDCVILEIDRPQEHAALLRPALPPTVKLVRTRYALNTPSLAHRGALRIARRALWESMEEPPSS